MIAEVQTLLYRQCWQHLHSVTRRCLRHRFHHTKALEECTFLMAKIEENSQLTTSLQGLNDDGDDHPRASDLVPAVAVSGTSTALW